MPKIKNVEIKQEINLVMQNANKLLQLVNQILDMSKLEAGKMKKATSAGDMVKFIEALVSSFDPLSKNKHKKTTTFPYGSYA